MLRRVGSGDGLLGSAVHRGRLELAIRRREPVLVYAPAQTGSMTVAAAVQRALPDALILHMHRITERGLALAAERRLQTGGRDLKVLDRRAAAVRSALARSTSDWPVVTTVRDPVGREVSGFFSAQWQVGRLHPAMTRDSESLDVLLQQFLGWRSVWTCEEWLTNEFQSTIGVDLMDTPFDPQIGHVRFRAGRFRVLVLRTESLDAEAAKALAQHLGVPGTTLERRNSTADRPYAELYRWFVGAAVLPERYLDEAYGSRYARHFYTGEEREQARSQWMRATPSDLEQPHAH